MNPAVTLAFAVVRRLPWVKVPVYWAAQMLGAFVASACVYGVYHGKFYPCKVHAHILILTAFIFPLCTSCYHQVFHCEMFIFT